MNPIVTLPEICVLCPISEGWDFQMNEMNHDILDTHRDCYIEKWIQCLESTFQFLEFYFQGQEQDIIYFVFSPRSILHVQVIIRPMPLGFLP